MTKHTPTPWSTNGHVCVFKGNDLIAACQGHQDDINECKANAKFICKAVNNHEALVDIAKNLIALCISTGEHGEIYHKTKEVLETLKQAERDS